MLPTSTVRGWDTLPAYVNSRGASKIKARAAEQAAESNKAISGAPASVAGTWILTVKGPTGAMDSTLTLESSNGTLSGSQSGEGVTTQIQQISYDSATGSIAWSNQITQPMKLTLQFTGTVQNGSMTGKVKAGFMGTYPFTAQLAGLATHSSFFSE